MTFQAGSSGNPHGRPKGTGSRQHAFNALVEPHKEALFKKAIELALFGNEAMLRLFLDRMLPAKPKDEPVGFAMPELDNTNIESLLPLSLNILQAASKGEVTPQDCRNIAALIAAHYKSISLEKDIRTLAKDIEKLKSDPQFNRSFSNK